MKWIAFALTLIFRRGEWQQVELRLRKHLSVTVMTAPADSAIRCWMRRAARARGGQPSRRRRQGRRGKRTRPTATAAASGHQRGRRRVPVARSSAWWVIRGRAELQCLQSHLDGNCKLHRCSSVSDTDFLAWHPSPGSSCNVCACHGYELVPRQIIDLRCGICRDGASQWARTLWPSPEEARGLRYSHPLSCHCCSTLHSCAWRSRRSFMRASESNDARVPCAVIHADMVAALRPRCG